MQQRILKDLTNGGEFLRFRKIKLKKTEKTCD